MKYIFRQVSSFIAPALFCIIIPWWIVSARFQEINQAVLSQSLLLVIPGIFLCLVGLAGFILTVRMIILIGKGTIMPWDPTRHLVTTGLYAYMRNPMISSVLLIMSGEALLFESFTLGVLVALFFVINMAYFILLEEPGLEKRFGKEYAEYKRNVPRWIPRLKPWNPG